MQSRKLAGPEAGVRKYDVLTALGTYALAADRSTQRRILRLITLITARYNWQRDILSIGRRDIAALWSVDERTVKREIGALKAMGLLTVKRPGARGRVTVYGLDLSAVFSMSEQSWHLVGTDFCSRMSEMRDRDTAPERRVIPFPRAPEPPGKDWQQILNVLEQTDPARMKAWYAPLRLEDRSEGNLRLVAPSEFHANYVATHMAGELLRAARLVFPEIITAEVTNAT